MTTGVHLIENAGPEGGTYIESIIKLQPPKGHFTGPRGLEEAWMLLKTGYKPFLTTTPWVPQEDDCSVTGKYACYLVIYDTAK